ncbi:MAG: shikimate dehydrogenase [Thermodesulfovibrionales bacterium]
MTISGTTRITGLFGFPVEHTLSPAMHNAAFTHLGLDFCYVPFLVHPDSLPQAVAAVRALNLAGVNVTIPHKEAVIPLLDEVSEEAAFIGAVNTVVNDGGRLAGHNTDGRGFMKSLEENGCTAAGRKVLVIGAGGASRAVCYYLSDAAESLTIVDVDIRKQQQLAADLSRIRRNVHAPAAAADYGAYDLIVNATPLGMKAEDPLPLPAEALRPEQTVCDLIYRTTPLLAAAAARGCRTIDGHGMLLWQGILAFELWTRCSAPVEIMRTALRERIR